MTKDLRAPLHHRRDRNTKHHFLDSSMFSGGNEATLTRKGNPFIPLKTGFARVAIIAF